MSEKSIKIGAAYIRVSTDDQLEYSPESQLEEIQAYCIRNNIILSNEHIYIEQSGRTGTESSKREAFQRMISQAKTTPKPFDVIVLWKFSRFARNQDESTFYKSMLRKKLNIDVVSVSEPLMEGMYGRLIEMIIEWQDEFYSVNLSAEVKRSMLSKAKKGLYNSRMPLGYKKEPNSLPVIVEEEAEIVRTVFNLFTTGHDINYVVRYLNLKGFKTATGKAFDNEGVRYILENPFYIGKVRWNRRLDSHNSGLRDESEWIISDSHHQPIIDMDTWNAAQDKLNRIKQTYSKYAHPVSHTKHWLSGMIKCPYCGKSLSYKQGYTVKKTGSVSGAGFQCLGYRMGLHNESQYISERKIVKAVLQSLHDIIESDTITFEIIKNTSTDTDLLQKMYQTELNSLSKKEKRIKEAYMNEIDTLEEYRKNKEMLNNRRNELLQLLNELDITNQDPAEYKQQFVSQVKSVINIIESDSDYELKAEALRSIIKKIVIHKDTDSLEFFYYLSV